MKTARKSPAKDFFVKLQKVLREAQDNGWYKTSSSKTDPKTIVQKTYLFAKDLEQKRYYYPVWLHRFEGKVPPKWKYWRNVYHDLKLAQEGKLKLEATQIDAAVMHPLFLVAKKTARSQKLNTQQLAWFFCRPYFLEPNALRREIRLVQEEKGVPQEAINQAVVIGHRVTEKIKKDLAIK